MLYTVYIRETKGALSRFCITHKFIENVSDEQGFLFVDRLLMYLEALGFSDDDIGLISDVNERHALKINN